MVIGSALFLVSAGPLNTLDVDTPLAPALGYQMILGVGQGIGIQMAIITGQAYSRPEDLSAATAIVLCKSSLPLRRTTTTRPSPWPLLAEAKANTVFQMMGGTVCVSMGQSAFSNRILSNLASNAPGIDAARVLATGASELRSAFPPDQVGLILESYMDGLRVTFALSAALTGCSFLASWVAPIRSIKQLDDRSGADNAAPPAVAAIEEA